MPAVTLKRIMAPAEGAAMRFAGVSWNNLGDAGESDVQYAVQAGIISGTVQFCICGSAAPARRTARRLTASPLTACDDFCPHHACRAGGFVVGNLAPRQDPSKMELSVVFGPGVGPDHASAVSFILSAVDAEFAQSLNRRRRRLAAAACSATPQAVRLAPSPFSRPAPSTRRLSVQNMALRRLRRRNAMRRQMGKSASL